MAKTEESGVPCSICLDLVNYDGERSRAKLQCGHEFHLDCIGSAFNMKGTMQCPNCRNIEKGRWSYASGSPNSSPELSMDDTSNESYPFYVGFPEMPYRIPICPFRGLAQVPPSPESSVGMMSTITPMVNQQHPNGNRPHPLHGWLQFHHAQFHHYFPLAPGLPRFIPAGRVYDPSGSFSLYGETTMNYSHPWVSENIPHFPAQNGL